MNQLYHSRNFATYQSDEGRCFHVDFGHKFLKMSFCQLLAFRQQVNKIDLEAHFNGNNPHGLEIISLCNREHLFIWGTSEIVELKQLISGTFTILELNSLISSC